MEVTKKILIIEDESSISMLYKKLLTNLGHEVDTAINGRIAEDYVTENEYDIIFCDIRLPEVSGIDFYVWLQQKYPKLTKKVIFMTGSVMGGETARFLEKSGRPYLLKPFRPSELLEIISHNVL